MKYLPAINTYLLYLVFSRLLVQGMNLIMLQQLIFWGR